MNKRLCYLLILFIPLFVKAEQKKEVDLPPLHHVVKVRPSSSIQVPKHYPLNDKKEIDCQTCHGIDDIEETPWKDVNKKAPDFFRDGPYSQLTDFCYGCHQKKSYERPNIHQLLDENGKYKEEDCEYCHDKAPDPEDQLNTSELTFRLPPEILCFGCHLKTPHLNALNHQVKPDNEMRKTMREAEKRLNIILPLDKDEKIMCVTCHSPHQIGLIDQNRPAGNQVADTDLDEGITYIEHPWNQVFQSDKETRLKQLAKSGNEVHTLSYQRIKTEVLLRASARDGTLCQSCHRFER